MSVDRRGLSVVGSSTETPARAPGQPPHHAFSYVELTVTDLAAAQAFYEAAFGWTFVDYGPGYAGIVDGSEEEVGGLVVKPAARPVGGPFVLIHSDDLDATLQAIVAAGGDVVAGPYDFPGGRRLHFVDPSGNELGVWSPVESTG